MLLLVGTKKPYLTMFDNQYYGGRRRIRTFGTLLHTVLAGQPFKPLKHSTIGVAHGWLVRGLE